MSRLDRHVSSVQNKLTFHHFIEALAWAVMVAAGVVTLVIVIERLCGVVLPVHHHAIWIGIGCAVGVCAITWAIWRRPKPPDAAVAIDDRLKLKEKFSTALYVRASADPFAKAAVLDAENTAEKVRLEKQFPVSFPTGGAWAVALIALVIAGPSVFIFIFATGRNAEGK